MGGVMKNVVINHLVFLLFCTFLGGFAQVRANGVEGAGVEERVVILNISGRVSARTLESVRVSLPRTLGDPVPAGLIVLLDSAGGDGAAAMAIGRILRAARAHIFVTGQCSSACVFILASGVVRSALPYSVGIHRGRVTKTDRDGPMIKEINTAEYPDAAEALKKFELAAEAYFAEMGASPGLFEAMQSHIKKSVYRLSKSELERYGLVGFEKNYFRERVRFFEAQKDIYKMNDVELRERTSKIASFCREPQSDQKSFVSCYAKALQNPRRTNHPLILP